MTTKFNVGQRVWFIEPGSCDLYKAPVLQINIALGLRSPQYKVEGDWWYEDEIFKTKREAKAVLAAICKTQREAK